MKRRQFQPPVRDGAVDVLKKPFRVPALGHLAKPAAAPAAAAPPPKAVPAPPAPAAAAPKPPPAGKCDAVVESLALAAASSYLKKKPLPSSAVATPSKAGDRAPAAPAASASEEDGSASDAQQPSPEPLPASPASPASVRKAPLKRLGPAPAHAKAAAAAPTPPLAPAQAAAPRARAAAPSPAPPSAVKRDGGGSPLIYVPRLAALPTDTLATLEATGLNTSWPEAMQIMGGLRQAALPAAADLPFTSLAATAAALEASILPQAVPLQEPDGVSLACLRQKVAEEALQRLPGFGSASSRRPKAPLKKLAVPAPKPLLPQPRAAAGHPPARSALPAAWVSAAAAAVLAPAPAVSKPAVLKPAAPRSVPTTPAPSWDKQRVQQRLAESSAIPLSFLRAILYA